MIAKIHISLLAAFIALSAFACGGDGGDGAYLTIIGNKNEYLDNNELVKLKVRYHDSDDKALNGQVAFRLVGTTGGASINKTSAVTDRDGVVEIDLRSGKSGAASFQIEASAADAATARWRISVGNGVPDLDPTGRYEVKSKMDIISGLDNDFGQAVNTFIDMTDDEHDPGSWVVDRALEELPEDVAKILGLFRKSIDPAVNKYIMDNAPGFVLELKDIGEQLGDVTRNFGVLSTLDIKKNRSNETDAPDHLATHQFTGVYFDIQGEESSYDLDDLNVDEIEAKELSVTKDSKNMIVIGQHQMPVTAGSAMVVVLERAIIPQFDDSANSLAEYLQNRVNCESFGDSVYDKVGSDIPLADAGTYESLCELGLEATAALIINKLHDEDKPFVTFDINGLARPRDTNGDRKVDTLQAGKWSGLLDYYGSQATLDKEDNTFTAKRITTSR